MTTAVSREAMVISSGTQSTLSPVSEQDFPVIGIGASAGGLSAFESFFSGIPEGIELNAAFVLVQHLSPDHKSILSSLIRHYTSMPVFDVQDGMIVQINTVYVIQPNHDMVITNRTLYLTEPLAPQGHRFPIDFFFRSLAQDQKDKAVCIILSGNGCDGSEGLRDIKEQGGMVLAQTAASSEFGGMPKSAMATGLVDFELAPSEMPDRIKAYALDSGSSVSTVAFVPMETEALLKKVLTVMGNHTGHDLSLYKTTTIYRRIERRMTIHHIDSIEDYYHYIQQSPQEIDTLFQEILIGVTSFFRDPASFKILEEAIPGLFFLNIFSKKCVRVWCAGCSTGEEAYSLAILVYEYCEKIKQQFKVVIFATDINSRAITIARTGRYPVSIEKQMDPKRLSRYFTFMKEENCYKVIKPIRDMVVFSTQNIIKDPPFSNLDIVSCRNLMIYMNVKLQKKIIPLLHYALRQNGLLFLGTSESVGEFTNLFKQIENGAKVYRCKNETGEKRIMLPNLSQPALINDTPETAIHSRELVVTGAITLHDKIEQLLLNHFSPAAALVTRKGDILYLYGRMGKYLETVDGETQTNNILKMSRNGLQQNMTILLRKAALKNKSFHVQNLTINLYGTETVLGLTVKPVEVPEYKKNQNVFLIVIQEHDSSVMLHQKKFFKKRSAVQFIKNFRLTDPDQQLASLGEELNACRQYIHTTSEEHAAAYKQLQYSHEELQSINEELQSTNEELETSKEEMQSSNEELSTMNAELQSKVVNLAQAGNDMNNLLASTDIATLFIDLQLRILRFTPATTRIINLIPGDIGRPVSHTVSNFLEYTRLVVDIQTVLDSLEPFEVNVETANHNWYTMRIRPYRTLDNTVEGAVITFIDITEIMIIKHDLEKANETLRIATKQSTV